MQFLSEALHEQLRCKNCTNYLSVPPITMTIEGHFCGRCHIAGLRATAYECLAKQMLFPCKNEACTKQLSFDKTQQHEASCNYTKTQCAFCEERIARKSILDHFRKDHADLVIPTSFAFAKVETEINFRRLMAFGRSIYIIEMRGTLDKFFLALTSVSDSKNVFYDLTIKSEGREIVWRSQKIIPFDSFQEFLANNEDMLCFEQLRSVLNSSEFVFEIKILGKAEKVALPEELECSICHEYMKPPIYICKTGHSLCATCKEEVSACPSCKSEFVGGRNFALEEIAERAMYCCENSSKCSFIGNLGAMKRHERKCWQTISCPLYVNPKLKCSWQGTTYDLYEHVVAIHPLHLLNLNQTLDVDKAMDQREVEYHVLRFDDNSFVLSIWRCLSSTLAWSVANLELKPQEEPKYNFVLEFLDQHGTRRKYIVNYPCVLVKKVQAPFVNAEQRPLKTDFNTLKPFTKLDGKICFKFTIEHAE